MESYMGCIRTTDFRSFKERHEDDPVLHWAIWTSDGVMVLAEGTADNGEEAFAAWNLAWEHVQVARLENWSVRSDPYAPPEAGRIWLSGEVYGRTPRFPDGHHITTSTLTGAAGRYASTSGGWTYRLGTIDPGYAKYCKENDIVIDPLAPVKVHKAAP